MIGLGFGTGNFGKQDDLKGGFNMLIKFDEKYLTISSEITNYAKREEMEKIQQLCGEIVEVIKSVRERRVVKV